MEPSRVPVVRFGTLIVDHPKARFKRGLRRRAVATAPTSASGPNAKCARAAGRLLVVVKLKWQADRRPALLTLSDHAACVRRCRVLPPALRHRLIILVGARTRIARLGVPIALEKEAEAVVAPVVPARNGVMDGRPARHEATLRLVA